MKTTRVTPGRKRRALGSKGCITRNCVKSSSEARNSSNPSEYNQRWHLLQYRGETSLYFNIKENKPLIEVKDQCIQNLKVWPVYRTVIGRDNPSFRGCRFQDLNWIQFRWFRGETIPPVESSYSIRSERPGSNHS